MMMRWFISLSTARVAPSGSLWPDSDQWRLMLIDGDAGGDGDDDGDDGGDGDDDGDARDCDGADNDEVVAGLDLKKD